MCDPRVSPRTPRAAQRSLVLKDRKKKDTLLLHTPHSWPHLSQVVESAFQEGREWGYYKAIKVQGRRMHAEGTPAATVTS